MLDDSDTDKDSHLPRGRIENGEEANETSDKQKDSNANVDGGAKTTLYMVPRLANGHGKTKWVLETAVRSGCRKNYQVEDNRRRR